MANSIDCVHNMNMNQSVSAPSGSQSISRAVGLLRQLSQAMPEGLTTSQAAERQGLSRPTAHRILKNLMGEGFVDRSPLTNKWLLGPELYILGAVAAERFDITELAAPAVNALAKETGESAFLSVRRGTESVCLTRVDGSFPIRSFVLYEGIRFPLGVASAGIAMLAFESDRFIDSYLATGALSDAHGVTHSADEIRDRIQSTRKNGFSVNPGLVVEGSWGMAAAIFSPAGRAEWALSLTGVDTRFTADRRPYLGKLLLEKAHEVTTLLKRQS